MNEFKFQNNERIFFDTGKLSGFGKIKGKASTDFPDIGSMWIIEGESFPVEGYPFVCLIMPECFIQKIK
jgi:hypothetical protein